MKTAAVLKFAAIMLGTAMMIVAFMLCGCAQPLPPPSAIVATGGDIEQAIAFGQMASEGVKGASRDASAVGSVYLGMASSALLRQAGKLSNAGSDLSATREEMQRGAELNAAQGRKLDAYNRGVWGGVALRWISLAKWCIGIAFAAWLGLAILSQPIAAGVGGGALKIIAAILHGVLFVFTFGLSHAAIAIRAAFQRIGNKVSDTVPAPSAVRAVSVPAWTAGQL